jgi:hypothetical protein
MSDPLSVASGLIAVIGAGMACANRLHNIIHAFRHAPLELAALSNEVNDLSAVLTEIEAAAFDTNRLPGPSQRQSNGNPYCLLPEHGLWLMINQTP